MSVEIYRLFTSEGTASSSHSDVRLFSDKRAFVEAVMTALIEAESRGDERTDEDRTARRATRKWRDLITWRTRTQVRASFGTETRRILSASKLVDGEWVELDPLLISPAITWKVNP